MSSVEIQTEAQVLLLSFLIPIRRTDDLLFLRIQIKSTLSIAGRQAVQYKPLFKRSKVKNVHQEK